MLLWRPGKKQLIGQQENDCQCHQPNDRTIEHDCSLLRNRFFRVDVLGTPETIRRQLKRPGKDNDQGKRQNADKQYQGNAPLRETESGRKNVCRLYDGPCHYQVSDGHANDITAFQFGEKRGHSGPVWSPSVTARSLAAGTKPPRRPAIVLLAAVVRGVACKHGIDFQPLRAAMTASRVCPYHLNRQAVYTCKRAVAGDNTGCEFDYSGLTCRSDSRAPDRCDANRSRRSSPAIRAMGCTPRRLLPAGERRGE